MTKVNSLYDRLMEVARAGKTITYGEIAPMLNLNMESQADRTEIGRILGEISTREHNEGRPMLSAVVVRKETQYPGEGFFNLARELGLHHGNDDLAFFVEELKRVHAYWKTH